MLEEIHLSVQEAKATDKVAEDNNRELDVALSKIVKAISARAGSMYKEAVYIPDGYLARVIVTGTLNKIYISRSLKGKVTLNSTGFRNKLVDL